ncbi:MAG: precorrin-6y C5,15-methyltransferase (decarboxylating) subunit CbiE [Deltaproteobacteria bacterium]|jgi:precorrin-6Y C5,15-methyltransferase (decarboxylating)|nr:precorrin-6y C5,15-methyltransferase (decarboxylating) subunit CbiE [Deltaproteobacteria bacterium]
MAKTMLTLMGLEDASELTPRQEALLRNAEVIAGPPRWLQSLSGYAASLEPLSGNLVDWLLKLEKLSQERETVVLASGDPNYYGLAQKLLAVVPPERVSVWPATTTVQKAFARLKTTWAGAEVVSLHGRDGDWPQLYSALYRAGRPASPGRVAVYTDPRNSPDAIARALLARGARGWDMTVLENLGAPDERIVQLALAEAERERFAPLNLVVLQRNQAFLPTTIGAPEEDYLHEKGLITKREVRALALGLLSLSGAETLWDIGAGSGSVSAEAGSLLSRGAVYGLEKNPDRLRDARENAARRGLFHVEFRLGEALELLEGLPRPDRIFLGGGGEDLPQLIQKGREKLNSPGIVVASTISLRSLGLATEALTHNRALPEIYQVSSARQEPLGKSFYFKPGNQVYLVKGVF